MMTSEMSEDETISRIVEKLAIKRKIVQIQLRSNGEVVCLCDDGSVWYQKGGGMGFSGWSRMNTKEIEETA